ncbi:MAG: T9SS type A sorting domain-containing protein [Leeuwenhoekiella sp.]
MKRTNPKNCTELHYATNRILFVAILLLVYTFQAQERNVGDIPADRLAIDGWKEIKFDSSGNWQTIDVTTMGVLPNTGADMAKAIEDMIMGGSGKTIYKFPAGTFNIDSSIQIEKGDFQILGEGSATKFVMRGGDKAPVIRIRGKREGSIRLEKSVNRGDNTIALTSISGFEVGDYLFLRQQNGERTFDLDTQIVKILSITGNTLTVDMKIGLPFSADLARVQYLKFLKNIKLSNFYLGRSSEPEQREGKLRMDVILNGEISHVESDKALGQHLEIGDCRDFLFFQNNVHGNFGRDTSGGYQGGIVVNRSTRVNVINNRLDDLRHHIMFQFGVNHSVVAYNRATIYNHYGDYGQHNNKGCHNNLFEGNFGSELYDDWNKKAWGAPYAMWFRNHAIVKIGTEYDGQTHMSIIANELQAGESGLKLADPNNDNYVAANIVNINGENGDGDMLWGDLDADATIPNSLFLTEKPDYLESWPLYGPNAGEATLSVGFQHSDQYNLTVFPNPITDTFTIRLNSDTPSKVFMYDILGKLVYKYTMMEEQVIVDQQFSSGLYLIRVENKNLGVFTKKVVIR